MSEEKLQALVEKGDLDGVLGFFKGMPEKERKKYEKVSRGLFSDMKAVQTEYFEKVNDTPKFAALHRRNIEASRRKVAGYTAVLASCPISSVRTASGDFHVEDCIEYISEEDDAAPIQALVDRRPPWLQGFAEWLAQATFAGWWMFIRRMVRQGLCDAPASSEYIRRFAYGVWVHSRQIHAMTLEDFAVRNVDNLQHEIWSLFSVDGAVRGEEGYCGENPWVHDSWFHLLPRMAARGLIPRDRLIDETIQALNRDFREIQLRWYIKFHKKLEISTEEHAAQFDKYFNLLSNKVPATVRLALGSLKEIFQVGKLDTEQLLKVVSPALASETKGVVVDALALLKIVGTKQKSLKPRIAALVSPALTHAAADINERAFALIQSFAKPELAEVAKAVRAHQEHAAPSVRAEIEQWLGVAGAKPVVDKPLDASDFNTRAKALPERALNLAGLLLTPGGLTPAPLAFRRSEVPCLDPDRRIEPIRDLDELVEVATAQLVEPADNEQVERIYDGIARLGTQRPQHFADLTSQLVKHAKEEHWRYAATSAVALRFLVHAWVIHGVIPRELESASLRARLLQERAGWITQRFTQGISQGLLAAPTHKGGWIDPRVLVDRALQLQSDGGRSDRIDWSMALLRLAPDYRHDALETATNVLGEEGAALRYSLGGPLEKPGHSPWLWSAASRARNPNDIDQELAKHFPVLAAEQIRPAEFSVVIEKRRVSYSHEDRFVLDVGAAPSMQGEHDSAHIALLFQASGRTGRRPYIRDFQLLDIRSIAGLWPMRREPYFALAASELGNNFDWLEARWADKAWLEPMLEPDCEMGEMAILLLAVGLGYKEPGIAGLATDILIAGIADGRINGEQLGARMGSMLFTGLIKPPRWAKTLGEAVRVSALHAREIRAAIERALADGKGEPPNGLHTLLELLFELSVDSGLTIENSHTQDFLARLSGSSKLVKVAQKLMKLEERSSGQPGQAELLAIQGRLERAERWTRWAQGGSDGKAK